MHSETSSYISPTKAEVVNDAIMSGQAAIILEGCTDPQKYHFLSGHIDKEFVLRPIELIDGFCAGGNEVIRFFKETTECPLTSPYLLKNVAGIIDKDIREFRNKMPEYEHIFTLKYYSIESHYICKEVLVKCLLDSTYAPQDAKLLEIANLIYNSFEDQFYHLYIASIDALKSFMVDGHKSNFTYSDKFGRLSNDQKLINDLEKKSKELNEYASSIGINMNIEAAKTFIKGKVFLDCYCHHIKNSIFSLQNSCEAAEIPQCNYCAAGMHIKCCYRTKKGVTIDSIKNSIISQTPADHLQYLIVDLNNYFN